MGRETKTEHIHFRVHKDFKAKYKEACEAKGVNGVDMTEDLTRYMQRQINAHQRKK